MRMNISNNSVFRPNNFIRTASKPKPVAPSLGRVNLRSTPMIGRLSNSRTCGSCGH